MGELKAVVCPKCGAQVALEQARDRGTCKYCGTVAYVEKPSRPAVKPAATARSKAPLWLGVVVLLGGLVLIMSRDTEPPAAPKPALVSKPKEPAVVPMSTPVAPVVPPAPVPKLRVASFSPARLVDVDGDKVDELLLPFQRSGGSSPTTDHFGVFDLDDGKLLHETPALDDSGSAVLTAVAYGRLIRAQPDGRLTSYDLASGNVQWTSVLGERVAALCEAPGGTSDALQVVSDDGRNSLLDVKTGRQSETKRECKVPLDVSMGRHAPSDRHDYRAPRGMAAFRCGGVRVMGSDNYTVPDACLTQLKVDSDRLPGMVGHSIWRTPRGLLVFGVRQPGAYVPSVGLLENKRWSWKNEVPAQDPLSAEMGGPRIVSLFEDRLLLGYRAGKPQQQWVTSFDVRDGTRTWSKQLSEGSGSLVTLVQNSASVVVQTEREVLVLTPSSGDVVHSIGAAN